MVNSNLDALSSLFDRVVVGIDLTPMGVSREGTVLGTDGGCIIASVGLSEAEMPRVVEGALGARHVLICELLHFRIELSCKVVGVRQAARLGPSRRVHIELAVEEVAALAA
jgi:hypothetical protein